MQAYYQLNLQQRISVKFCHNTNILFQEMSIVKCCPFCSDFSMLITWTTWYWLSLTYSNSSVIGRSIVPILLNTGTHYLRNVYKQELFPSKAQTEINKYGSKTLSNIITLYIDGSIQERRNSIANALELHLSCTNPSTWNSGCLVSYSKCLLSRVFFLIKSSLIARLMRPTWGPPGSCRPQMGPMLAPST